MSTTTDQGLVLPDSADNDNVPLSFGDYNAGVEARLAKRYASVADRTARNPTPAESEFSILIDLNRCERYTGAFWVPVGWYDSARVDTFQSTTSLVYADLTTVGPAVTVTTDATAEVTLGAAIVPPGSTLHAYMGFTVSGATTLAADDIRALYLPGAFELHHSLVVPVTGLTPGVNTFTARYKVNSGTGQFRFRTITVRPN